MGFQVDLIRGAFVIVGIAFFGAITQSNPGMLTWISETFFGGASLGFYQYAAIYSIISVFAYLFASILARSIVAEQEERE